jgi:hypothetical protein
MDPQACLNELIRAALASDDDEVADLAAALVTWHERGGFEPSLNQSLNLAIAGRKMMQEWSNQ